MRSGSLGLVVRGCKFGLRPHSSPSRSFYRRLLPSSCIDFASDKGKKIFAEALQGPYMNAYFPLASQFRTQSEPAFCGLTSLAMTLNALRIDPMRVWKGVWRWYSEELLDCCVSLDYVKQNGITIPEVHCLASCNGALVESHLAMNVNEDDFRQAVKTSTTSGETLMIASYDRRALGQTGIGHFSPIGGYYEAGDMALILDVARFKYSPHWVPLSLLFKSMLVNDTSTGMSRGFLILRPDDSSSSLLARMHPGAAWKDLANAQDARLSTALSAVSDKSSSYSPYASTRIFVSFMVRELAPLWSQVFTSIERDVGGDLSPEHRDVIEKLYDEVRKLPVYDVFIHAHNQLNEQLRNALSTEMSIVIALAWLQPILHHSAHECMQSHHHPDWWNALPASLRAELLTLLQTPSNSSDSLLAVEILALRKSMTAQAHICKPAPNLGGRQF